MKKMNMLIALTSAVLLTGSVHAMQAKPVNVSNPTLSNSIVNTSVQQNKTEPLRLAKDQRCKSDRDTGIVRCTTNS